MGDTITNYRLPKRIRLTIACLYLNSYFAANDRGVIAKAREVLDQHNIQLDVLLSILHTLSIRLKHVTMHTLTVLVTPTILKIWLPVLLKWMVQFW